MGSHEMNINDAKRSTIRHSWEALIETARGQRGEELAESLQETIVAQFDGYCVHLIARSDTAYARVGKNLEYLARIIGDILGEDTTVACIIELPYD